ncbi:hypothetical protein [Nocardia sp. NPDC050175]|uniref:hypothetical protein n=1 Tax=Nocardia sp. NPDC050175 TaxID=3364317 RepID=UPI0037B83177
MAEGCKPGTYRAVDSGKSPLFQECQNGKWVTKSCGPGTVAFETADGQVYCGFPVRNQDDDA